MKEKSEEVGLDLYLADVSNPVDIPYADSGIRAGFPSPAQDYMTDSIDLNKELIRHKETTFMARVKGDSLQGAGIYDGDLVIIDKALEAADGDYVAAFIDGDFTLKQFRMDHTNNCGWLMPANEKYTPIRVTPENDFMIWGVLTFAIHRLFPSHHR